jgi:hypothetical protein
MRKNKRPLHLFVDESHLFAPQGKVSDPQSGAMLHAANNLVSLGRSRGLRIILITQRPAKLHKDSLTQVETLVALRLIAPQDRGAVEDWIKYNADEKQGREILTSLATLPTGEGWIWAPRLSVLERVTFPKIKTFDTSRAPEEGESGDGPVLAPIDLEAIKNRLAVVNADAVANDPVRLRAEIAKLKRELSAKPAAMLTPSIDQSAIAQAEQRGFAHGWRDAVDAAAPLISKIDDLKVTADQFRRMGPKAPPQISRPHTNGRTRLASPASVPMASPDGPSAENGTRLSRAERLILTALAQYQGGRAKNQVAVLTGYAVNGGGFHNAISSLRTAGHITTGYGDQIEITDNGLAALGSFDPLPNPGPDLLDHWMRKLAKAERETLRVLTEAYPDALPKDEVAARAGYGAGGGGFNNAVSRLRTLELISGKGELRASEHLF